MSIQIKVNNNVRKFRFFSNEMTQAELAEQVGVSRQTIISIESGKYLPSLELSFRIAELFKVSISEIFSYEVLTD
ncbi:MAG: helix-turn-helix transcriptional regulator [Candidatus Dojkabacteria bacterium]